MSFTFKLDPIYGQTERIKSGTESVSTIWQCFGNVCVWSAVESRTVVEHRRRSPSDKQKRLVSWQDAEKLIRRIEGADAFTCATSRSNGTESRLVDRECASKERITVGSTQSWCGMKSTRKRSEDRRPAVQQRQTGKPHGLPSEGAPGKGQEK